MTEGEANNIIIRVCGGHSFTTIVVIACIQCRIFSYLVFSHLSYYVYIYLYLFYANSEYIIIIRKTSIVEIFLLIFADLLSFPYKSPSCTIQFVIFSEELVSIIQLLRTSPKLHSAGYHSCLFTKYRLHLEVLWERVNHSQGLRLSSTESKLGNFFSSVLSDDRLQM